MAVVDELARQISERAGISEGQARTAAETAIRFLDSRLPAPVGGNLQKLAEAGGASGGAGDLGKLAGGLGGVLGRKP